MFTMKNLLNALGIGLGINPAAIALHTTSPAKPKRRTRSVSRNYGSKSTLWKPNGERECARRRRQIAAGILQVPSDVYCDCVAMVHYPFV